MIESTEFDKRWQKILDRADALKRIAKTKPFTGGWDPPIPPVKVEILPPATEEKVKSVEGRLSSPIPALLRQVYTQGSEGVDIQWCVPGEFKKMPEGFWQVVYDYTLPAPFEKITGGGFSFHLDDLIKAKEGVEATIDFFKDPGPPYDETFDDPAHFKLRTEVWANSFGFTHAKNGDIFAVSSLSNGEVCNLSHEVYESPASFYGLNFLEFIEYVSAVGFVARDWEDLSKFYTGPSSPVQFYKSLSEGLWPPLRSGLKVDDPLAIKWRNWLGDLFSP